MPKAGNFSLFPFDLIKTIKNELCQGSKGFKNRSWSAGGNVKRTVIQMLFNLIIRFVMTTLWNSLHYQFAKDIIPFHVIADAFKMAVRDRECKGLESKYVSKRWKCFRKFEVSVTVEQSVHGVSETTHLAFDTDNLLFVRKNLATAFCNVVCTCINVPCVEFSKYLYSL